MPSKAEHVGSSGRTPPPADRRAAERDWDAFVVQHRRPRSVRSDILASWCRSVDTVPSGRDAAPVNDDAVATWRDSPMARSFACVERDVADVAHDGDFVAALTDADGVIVWTSASRDMERKAHDVAFVPGGDWNEPAVGTNALTLALREATPASVFSAEHFLPMVHDWVCYSAPIVLVGSDRPCGVLDLSTTWEKSSPLALATVTALARIVQMDLAARSPARGGRPDAPDAPLEIVAMGPGRVLLGGVPLTLSPRQVEILAVLALHPEGMSLAELVDELHGERPVNPVTVRVELSHVRQVIGERLQSRPYRLAGPVVADHVALLAALADGHVEAAVRAYEAPFLTRSTAWGIEETRRYIDVAVRRAVLGGGEAGQLLSLSSALPDDAYVAECALEAMPDTDPRRALVAARLATLEAGG
jgi:hypothetical protein